MKSFSNSLRYELGERECDAINKENTGNKYQRQGVIADRWLDGLIMKVEEYEKQCHESDGPGK